MAPFEEQQEGLRSDLPQRVVLVLDDCQFITQYDSHNSMAFFVEHLPENIHLVVASRSDPPLHLGRLRARGVMNEICTEQLAFSEEETATLVNEKMRLSLSPAGRALWWTNKGCGVFLKLLWRRSYSVGWLQNAGTRPVPGSNWRRPFRCASDILL